MKLPVLPPIEPMLAASVPELPIAEGMTYEPKWDGFRCIIFRDGDEVELTSRGGKTFTRYFPEIVAQARRQLPVRSVIDGELVVIRRDREPASLDFDRLSQRIHPAASRVALLAETSPASFIAFDLLALGDKSLMAVGYRERRAALEAAREPGLRARGYSTHLTPVTTDPQVAQGWFEVFEGAGLDGVVAKPADLLYVPGKRLMYKIKHTRTADVVVAGFRWHASGPVVGSLLLGLYDETGLLHHVGVSASFTRQRREELVDELAPYRDGASEQHPWLSRPPAGDDAGTHPATAAGSGGSAAAGDHDSKVPGQRVPGGVSRWTGKRNLEWVPLRPELVIEVGYDAMEGDRFRHTARFKRWRPDRAPRSCTYAQLERPLRFDVDNVLRGGVPGPRAGQREPGPRGEQDR